MQQNKLKNNTKDCLKMIIIKEMECYNIKMEIIIKALLNKICSMEQGNSKISLLTSKASLKITCLMENAQLYIQADKNIREIFYKEKKTDMEFTYTKTVVNIQEDSKMMLNKVQAKFYIHQEIILKVIFKMINRYKDN